MNTLRTKSSNQYYSQFQKFPRINVIKKVKVLYSFKTPKKEIKEDTRRLKDLSRSWLCRINVVKLYSYITKCVSEIQYNSHQTSNDILHRNRSFFPKIPRGAQKTLLCDILFVFWQIKLAWGLEGRASH